MASNSKDDNSKNLYLDIEYGDWQNMSINARLKAIRKGKHISIKKLAENAGLSTKTISNYEKGIKGPSSKTLEKLSDSQALDESMDFMVTGIREKEEKIITEKDLISEKGSFAALKAVDIYLRHQAEHMDLWKFTFLFENFNKSILNSFLNIYRHSYLDECRPTTSDAKTE